MWASWAPGLWLLGLWATCSHGAHTGEMTREAWDRLPEVPGPMYPCDLGHVGICGRVWRLGAGWPGGFVPVSLCPVSCSVCGLLPANLCVSGPLCVCISESLYASVPIPVSVCVDSFHPPWYISLSRAVG